MFDCPSCGSKTSKLIIYNDPKKLGCPSCGTPQSKFHNVNLGQTVDSYTRKDGTKGRITTGKAWEIEHRRLGPDGRAINSKTGKEPQY